MPESDSGGNDGANHSSRINTSAGTVTTQEQGAGAQSSVPEAATRENSEGNPFYPEVVDVESVSTDPSEERRTFADRLRNLIKRHRRDDDEDSIDCEVDQLVNSLDHYIVGYPKVAAFINADPSFLIYRKFGWLHNRILLYLQDEIVALEYKLNKLDQGTFTNDKEVKLKSRRADSVNPGPRRDTVKQIAEKLKEYDEHLLRFQKIQAIRRPTLRNQTSLYNFIYGTQSIVASEARWIREGADLAAVAREEEHGWFNGFLEDTLKKISPRATQVSNRVHLHLHLDDCMLRPQESRRTITKVAEHQG
ncbi:MAG: hypothetical protein Q9180_000303 [Flavoplaca navasiana]